MNIRQLETLIAVVDLGNLVKAAKKMSLTPSAVSQQITALEEEIGTALFDRSTRPPSLNSKGSQLLEAARQITHILDDALNSIKGSKMSGALDIGAVRSSVFGILPPAIASLKKNYPHLKIRLRVGLTSELMFEVAAERLNAAIVAKPTKILSDIIWHEFTREPLFLIAPPGTPQMSFEDLLTKFPFIRFHRDVPLAHIIDAEIAKMGIHIRPSIEIDSIYGIIQCVTSGLGVAIAPHTAIFNSRPVDIVPFPFGDPQVFREIGIIQHRNNPKEPLIRKLHDKLAKLSDPFGIFRDTSEL